MRILIADDDYHSRRLLEILLARSGYEVVSVADGQSALDILQSENAPPLAILDWMMPDHEGLDICRRVREATSRPYVYIIIVTAKGREDAADGLDAGADDYISKPFNPKDLSARIRVGERVIELERRLSSKVSELESALSQVRVLKSLLPICMYCKRIRDDQDYWHRIEAYIHAQTGTDFSHGICPDCYERGLSRRRDPGETS